MFNLKKAEELLIKLQNFDTELVNLTLTDDGNTRLVGRIGDARNILDDHYKFIDYAREGIKQSQKCIGEIIKDLKLHPNN